MTVPILRLLPIAPRSGDLELTAWLGAALTRRTGMPAVQSQPVPIDPAWRDPSDGTLSSSGLVDDLVERYPEEPTPGGREWTLAVTREDLTAPGREFVFGEATLGGAWAVVSTFRLECPERADEEIVLRERLLKEALHEIGHIADLPHCSDSSCVMAPSSLAEDVDSKGTAFCGACQGRFDALVRGLRAP